MAKSDYNKLVDYSKTPVENKIILREDDVVNALKKYIDECDGDELARIAGDTFGGFCTTADGIAYEFIPTDNYVGEFDNIKKKRRVKEK